MRIAKLGILICESRSEQEESSLRGMSQGVIIAERLERLKAGALIVAGEIVDRALDPATASDNSNIEDAQEITGDDDNPA